MASKRRRLPGKQHGEPGGAIPTDVPILFTVGVDTPDVELFSILRI